MTITVALEHNRPKKAMMNGFQCLDRLNVRIGNVIPEEPIAGRATSEATTSARPLNADLG